MKKVTLLLLSLAFIAGTTAQEHAPKERNGQKGERHRDHQERRDAHRNEVKTSLGMTDLQASQWDRITATYDTERKAARDAHNVERDAFKSTMKDIRERERAEMNTILTSEQQKKLDELREERKQHYRSKKGHGKGKGHGKPEK